MIWPKHHKRYGSGEFDIKDTYHSWTIANERYSMEFYSYCICGIPFSNPAVIEIPDICVSIMMTPSNGKSFRATGLCAGNSPVTIEFPSQRPVTQSLDVFFDLCPNKRLSKQSIPRWFGTQSRSLWRHCDVEPLMVTFDHTHCHKHRPHMLWTNNSFM